MISSEMWRLKGAILLVSVLSLSGCEMDTEVNEMSDAEPVVDSMPEENNDDQPDDSPDTGMDNDPASGDQGNDEEPVPDEDDLDDSNPDDSNDDPGDENPNDEPEPDTVFDASVAYANQCSGCHGASGEGLGVFPALTEFKSLSELSLDVASMPPGGAPDCGETVNCVEYLAEFIQQNFMQAEMVVIADSSASSVSGTVVPVTIQLDASASTYDANANVAFEWFINDERVSDQSQFSWTITDVGVHEVELRLMSGSLSDSDSWTMTTTMPDVEPEFENAFSCDADEALVATTVKRLSKQQYQNTIETFLLRYFDTGFVANTMAELQPGFDQIPSDHVEGTFANHDQRTTDYHMGGYVDIAFDLSTALTFDLELLAEFAGDYCVFVNNDQNCIAGFVDRFGPVLLRRPLTEEDREFYIALQEYQTILATMLLSPDFLYHAEFAGDLDGDVLSLDNYAIANRLAYHFWQTMPDDALFSDAESGRISTEFSAVVTRVFNDEKTIDGIRTFYAGWLQLDEIPEFNQTDTQAFNTFVTSDYTGNRGVDVAVTTDWTAYRQGAIDSLQTFLDYITWDQNGQLADLFTSNVAFVENEALARATGVELWNGQYDQDSLTYFPAEQRAGILTRPAMQMYGSERNRPILKGVRVLNHMVCNELPPPDNNDTPAGVVILPEYTTRQQVTAITDHPNTNCITCHTLINPLGFATEHYDAIGRYRNEEIIMDDSGFEFLRGAIDASGNVDLGDGPNIAVEDGVQFSTAVANASETSACFVRHYHRYTYRRDEEMAADSCSLAAVYSALEDDGDIVSMLRSIVDQPAFLQRRLTSTDE